MRHLLSTANGIGLALPMPSASLSSFEMNSREHLLEQILRASKCPNLMSEQSLYCETCCFLIERTNLAYWHRRGLPKVELLYICAFPSAKEALRSPYDCSLKHSLVLPRAIFKPAYLPSYPHNYPLRCSPANHPLGTGSDETGSGSIRAEASDIAYIYIIR